MESPTSSAKTKSVLRKKGTEDIPKKALVQIALDENQEQIIPAKGLGKKTPARGTKEPVIIASQEQEQFIPQEELVPTTKLQAKMIEYAKKYTTKGNKPWTPSDLVGHRVYVQWKMRRTKGYFRGTVMNFSKKNTQEGVFTVRSDRPCEDTNRAEEEEILLGPKPVNWFLINRAVERPDDEDQDLDEIILDPLDSSEDDGPKEAIEKPKTKKGQKRRRKAPYSTKKRVTRAKSSVAASAKS